MHKKFKINLPDWGRPEKKWLCIMLLVLCCLSYLLAAPCGDVNSDNTVNIVDALMTAQFYVGLNPNPFDTAMADVDGNNTINIVDALQIAQFYVGIIAILKGCTMPPDPPPTVVSGEGPIGFASVNWNGQNGTTGGAGGPTVTVTNRTDFLDYISRSEPYIIQVSGMISLPGPMHDVASDKTIVGLGSISGIHGGGGLNIGHPMDDTVLAPPPDAIHNIIIRNMIFTGGSDDLINIMMYAHHVWIDHCDFSDPYDGALDIKRGANCVTVSWNHFHNTNKTTLVGHSDGNGDQDRGYLKVTYYNNHFDQTNQRHPRVRFGEVHVFNNFYYDCGIGVAGGSGAEVYVEANYFDDVSEPFERKGGTWLSIDNVIVGGIDELLEGSDSISWDPGSYYSYNATTAEEAREQTLQFAGVGILGF